MHRVKRYGRQAWRLVNITGATCLGVVLGLPMTGAELANDPGQPGTSRRGTANPAPVSAIMQEGTRA